MKTFIKKHPQAALAIAVTLGIVLLAAAATVFLMLTEPWAQDNTASPGISSAISSALTSSDTQVTEQSSVPAPSQVHNSLSSTLPDGVYFYEDFHTKLKASDGWAKDASVSNGKYTGSSIMLTGLTEVTSLRDYAVEAEITVNDFGHMTNPKVSVAAVIGRYKTSGDTGGGFEVGYATVNADGRTYIRVYDRLAQKELLSINDVPLYAGTAHKLTAVFSGTQVGIFVDGVYMGKVAVENRAGGVGLSRSGHTAIFDEFTVRKATSAELDSIKNGKAWTGTSSVDPLPEGTYFYEDFEDDTKATDGWNTNAKVKNGEFNGTSLILSKHEKISAMSDYAVETTLRIEEAESGIKTNVAAILGRYTSKVPENSQDGKAKSGGYEIGYAADTATDGKPGKTYIRVYDRINAKQLATFQFDLHNGAPYKLTAVFSGTQLYIFIDDEYVGKVAVENRAGTVGIARAGGYNAYYDDFTVRKPTQAELNTIQAQ